MTELERMEREILAAEFEKLGISTFGYPGPIHEALKTALTQAPPGWRLVPVDLMDRLPVSENGLCAPISREWMAEQVGYTKGFNNARKMAIEMIAAAPEYKEVE